MRASAHAKINLGLVVGSRREDGRHELVTVLQAVELADELSVEPADAPEVTGFAGDTIVSAALSALARAVGTERGWRVHIEKQIPVAAGLGGGSSDAATALRLANRCSARSSPTTSWVDSRRPSAPTSHSSCAKGRSSRPATAPSSVRRRYRRTTTVLLVVPHDVVKESTAGVYGAFDGAAARRGSRSRGR